MPYSLPKIAALGLALALSACGQQSAEQAPDAAAEVAKPSMSEMNMASENKLAKSTGTVTEVDKRSGRITLDHAPIPEASWPAMKMAFDADPAILGEVKVGDKVNFDVEITGTGGRVTAITRK